MGGYVERYCSQKLIGSVIGRTGRIVTADGFVEQFIHSSSFETACDVIQSAAGGGLEGGYASPIARLAALHAAVKGGRESPGAHEVQGQDGDDKYVESFSHHIFLVMSVFMFYPSRQNIITSLWHVN